MSANMQRQISGQSGEVISDPLAQSAAVVLLASYAPSLWNFRSELIRALRRRGYRVIACAPGHPEAAERLTCLDAEFMDIGPNRTSINPVRDLQYLVRILRLCRSVRPVAVIGYTAKPVVWGSLAARIAAVPKTVSMITGLGFAFIERERRSFAGRVVERLYGLALHTCNVAVFQNEDDKRELLRRGLVGPRTTSFVVNGSGVDLVKFGPKALPVRPVFLLIARMIRDKGVREFCEAAELVRARLPSVYFRLVGWFDAENPRALSPAELRELCGNGTVEYRGPVEDVRPELEGCRIYVLPSYREGTPRTVLEAMAMGRPIITTDVPGCRETVRDGWNGYLVPPRDSRALADAMERLVRNPDLAEEMGANSRAMAELKYDARLIAASVLAGAAL